MNYERSDYLGRPGGSLDGDVRRLEEAILAERELRRARREDDLRAQDKFEASVIERFGQVNKFRGALEDLGKQMATRRELEAAIAAISARIDANSTQIAEQRSRIDSGPEGLRVLQSRVDQGTGHYSGVSTSAKATAALISVVAVIVGLAFSYWSAHKSAMVVPETPVTVTQTSPSP